MDESPIGLVGIGLLGTALAERMLAAGLRVIGCDRDASAAERLRSLGGNCAAQIGEVADKCNEIVFCLPDSHVVESVVDKLGNRLTSGKLIIDATTGDPDATAALASRLAARGVGYIDATIAGSSEQARRGEAVVIIGGAADHVRGADRVLQAWSEHRFHVGSAGSGARLKLIVNLVLGLNRAVLAEGLALAERCGVDPTSALDVLKVTPAYSKVMDTKGPKMIAGEYSTQARLGQHLKDVRLIRELARRHDALTPLSDLHESLLQAAVDLGYADADNSAIIEAFR